MQSALRVGSVSILQDKSLDHLGSSFWEGSNRSGRATEENPPGNKLVPSREVISQPCKWALESDRTSLQALYDHPTSPMLKPSPFPGCCGVINWTMSDTCTETQKVPAHTSPACNSCPFPGFKNSVQGCGPAQEPCVLLWAPALNGFQFSHLQGQRT